MNDKSMTFYYSWIEILEKDLVSKEEFADLTLALVKYARDQEEITFQERGLNMIYRERVQQVQRDKEKYKKRCEQNSENIKKRWGKKENQTNTNEYNRIQSYTNHTNHTDIDKDIDKDIDVDIDKDVNNISCSNEFEREFDLIWNEYPKKQGKKKSLKHYVKFRKSKKVSFDEVMQGVKNYANEVKDKDKQYIKNGDTWFGNECWNDEYNSIVDEVSDDWKKNFTKY